MKCPGQIILFPFPHTDRTKAKLRPALLIQEVPGDYGDWLICMISSQLHHEVKGFDDILRQDDADFSVSGLKTSSLIRLGRLAVVESSFLMGAIGSITTKRLEKIKSRICEWLTSS